MTQEQQPIRIAIGDNLWTRTLVDGSVPYALAGRFTGAPSSMTPTSCKKNAGRKHGWSPGAAGLGVGMGAADLHLGGFANGPCSCVICP
jgi:hypothetical protein